MTDFLVIILGPEELSAPLLTNHGEIWFTGFILVGSYKIKYLVLYVSI